jgi:anti-sigma factor RsiW
MNCQHCIEFLMAYCDDELPEDERKVFEQHMRMCQSCWDYLESYRTTVALAKSMGEEPPMPKSCDEIPEDMPKAMPEVMLNAILAARKSSKTSS